MASATLSLMPSLNLPTPRNHYYYTSKTSSHTPPTHTLSFPISSPQSFFWLPRRIPRIPKPSPTPARSAYITGPASDPIISTDGTNVDDDHDSEIIVQPSTAISWGLLWTLLARHKLRLTASILSLICCSTCTLSMPIFSGRFFEVLIGARPEPLWKLLSKVAVLYTLEPIVTVIYVVNMNTIWENVMSSLRAQIFSSVLIRKVEFFDRYKVGELTSLLTSDLGSLKNIVSENISRDRGFRALSEASYSTLSKSCWNNMPTVCSSPPACTNIGYTYACRICFSW